MRGLPVFELSHFVECKVADRMSDITLRATALGHASRDARTAPGEPEARGGQHRPSTPRREPPGWAGSTALGPQEIAAKRRAKGNAQPTPSAARAVPGRDHTRTTTSPCASGPMGVRGSSPSHSPARAGEAEAPEAAKVAASTELDDPMDKLTDPIETLELGSPGFESPSVRHFWDQNGPLDRRWFWRSQGLRGRLTA